jgi:hypothetical protein
MVAVMSRDWEQYGWRVLVNQLYDYGADDWADDVLLPWVAKNDAVRTELHEIGAPESHRVLAEPEPRGFSFLWGLYALSRVLDVLISPFQPVNDDPEILSWLSSPRRPWWDARIPSADAYPRFMEALGCARIAEDRFHPFFHEIVTVEPTDDPDQQPELVDERWPGYLVGSMLLVRAGVTVRAGANVLDPDVASDSPLYWSWWRRYRRSADLSHGWGQNSQWGTDFRRDYVVDDELHYNVDHRLHRQRLDLPPDEALSLLQFRCSTTVDHGFDQWPWGDHYVERRATS